MKRSSQGRRVHEVKLEEDGGEDGAMVVGSSLFGNERKMRVHEKENASDLGRILRFVEESQDRECVALKELEVVQKRVREEKRKVKETLKKRTEDLRKQEELLLARVEEKEQTIEKRKVQMKQAMGKTNLHNACLREQLALALKENAEKKDTWERRIVELEKGVRALIDSTTEAIEDTQKRFTDEEGGLYCQMCLDKSDEITKLRENVRNAETLLQDELKRHSNVLVQLEERNEKLQDELEETVNKFENLLNEANVAHATAEQVSALTIRQVKEDCLRLQKEKDDIIQRCQGLLSEAEKNHKDQVEASTKSTQVLRELYESEKQNFEAYRDRVAKEKVQWALQLEQVTSQKNREKEMFDAFKTQIETENAVLRSKVEQKDEELIKANGEIKRLRERLEKHAESEEQGMDLLSTWKARSQIQCEEVTKAIRKSLKRARKRKEKDEEKNKTRMILLTELQTLRTLQGKHESSIKALEQDKDWLRKERNAVADGMALQQAAVQDQLKVLASLRESLEIASLERSMMMKDNIAAFDEIKNGFLQLEDEENRQ